MELHKPSVKLAGLYLALLMLISIFFSVSMYTASVQEIGRGYGRIGAGLSRNIDEMHLHEMREAQLDLSRTALRNQLIAINFVILLAGGFLSYYFARKTLEPIEAAQEAQNRFTSDASHELRTPITAIRSETEAFLLDPNSSLSEAKTVMRSTIEELDKLTVLTDGLLRLARSSSESIRLSETSLGELVSAAVNKINDTDIKRIETKLSKADASKSVSADIDLMSDAIKILIENAIKYSDKTKNIDVAASVNKSNFTITVKDRGAGIKQSQLPYIFDRFYQGDASRSKSKSPGFGIGLSIVKSIVDLHKGKITVDSKVGKGSTFTITVPRSL